MIYLDHAASAPLHPKAKEAMVEAMNWWGNPTSNHRYGKRLGDRLETYRNEFKKLAAGEFIFTSSATESNNTVLKGLSLNQDSTIWLAKGDHPSLARFIDTFSCPVMIIPYQKNGTVDFDTWREQLKKSTGPQLIALSHIDGQTGVNTLSKEQICFLKREYPDCWLHLDSSHGVTRIDEDFMSLPYDSLTICAHKLGGPIGIAGLYLKRAEKISPLLLGGGHEFDKRSSTPSLLLCAGFLAAFRASLKIDKETIKHRKQEIISLFGKYFDIDNPFIDNGSDFIIPLFIKKLTSDLFIRFFEERNVYLSSKAACSSRNKTENLALSQLGYSQKEQQQFLRISIGEEISSDQIKELDEILSEIQRELKPLLR